MKQTLCILFLLCTANYSFGESVWNQKSKIPAVGRHRGTGLAIANKGYIGLGHMNGTGNNIVYSDWWEFDPATNSWTQKSDYPIGTYGSIAFSVENYAYVNGGVYAGQDYYKYSPATNEWTPISSCPVDIADRTAFTVSNKAYVVTVNQLYQYTPETDIWEEKQAPTFAINSWCTSFTIGSSGYVKSGTSLYEYKPSVDAWAERASFPGENSNGSASFSIDGVGYIVSGYSGFLSPVVPFVWSYNPASNSWTQEEDFYGTSRRFSASFSINGKGYIGSGTNGTNMNDFWEFNPGLEGLDFKESENIKISAYPNPANEQISFNLKNIDNGNYSIIIFDTFGRLIENKVITEQFVTLQRNELASGLYFYKITENETLITKGTFIFE